MCVGGMGVRWKCRLVGMGWTLFCFFPGRVLLYLSCVCFVLDGIWVTLLSWIWLFQEAGQKRVALADDGRRGGIGVVRDV